MRSWRWAWMGAMCVCLSAQALTRGWLRFGDGNVVSGELLASDADGGEFRSDRFGTLRFTHAQARFEPLAAAPAPASASALAAPVPGQAELAEQLGWRPASWSIAVSGYWRRDAGSTTSDLALDFDGTWQSRRDELRLALSANYKVVDRAVDTNDQDGSLRWLREVSDRWVALGQVKVNRSTFSLPDPLPVLDYALVQASVGTGPRWRWASGGRTLVTLNYDRLMLQLLRLDRRLYARAMSVLVDNRLRLSPRVDFSNTLIVYRWPHAGTGYDSDAELSYRLSDQLSVGLRHEYRRNAVSLSTGTYHRVSLTTRLGF